MENTNREKNILFQRLETERLILKQLSMDDKDFIFKQFSDPEVCRYFDEEPFTVLEEAEELIEWYARPDRDPWRPIIRLVIAVVRSRMLQNELG